MPPGFPMISHRGALCPLWPQPIRKGSYRGPALVPAPLVSGPPPILLGREDGEDPLLPGAPGFAEPGATSLPCPRLDFPSDLEFGFMFPPPERASFSLCIFPLDSASVVRVLLRESRCPSWLLLDDGSATRHQGRVGMNNAARLKRQSYNTAGK